MEQRALGRSGVVVSRIILGCGNFGGLGSSIVHYGAGETEGEAHAIMDAAWEAGITTFDTADAYGGGRSESFIGRWLSAQGPDVREGGVVQVTLTHAGQRGEAKGEFGGFIFVVPGGQIGQTVWVKVKKLAGKMAFSELTQAPA